MYLKHHDLEIQAPEGAEPVQTTLAYGEGRIAVDLPDDITVDVVEPLFQAAATDPMELLREAMRRPVHGPGLREMARSGQQVVIAMCDGTRAQPRHLMIPAVIEELAELILPADITVLVATGTHRGNTDAELREMLGDLADELTLVNHDCRDDDALRSLGWHNDVPVVINKRWLDADLRITTGFVEPHLFAGFSGGPKLVTPGLAGLETVLALHNAKRIASPHATWGRIEGNPVHDDIRAIVAAHGAVDFSLDVALNRNKEIVAAFGGELFAMHATAREWVRDAAMQMVDAPYDVVITCNSGYPLDQNLYQAVKGVSAAAQIVKPGGLIICAAEARDGFPDHGAFRALLESVSSPAELLASMDASSVTTPDQWQAQILARIQATVRVVMHTDGLSDAELRAANLEQVASVSDEVVREVRVVGAGARVCVLPEGPQTIAYLDH
jgi:nickel-dependent lactate racemase